MVKISIRRCFNCGKNAYGAVGRCMNTACHLWRTPARTRGTKGKKRMAWHDAQKVMIILCCCLSSLELLNNSYKTLSFGKVIASGSF